MYISRKIMRLDTFVFILLHEDGDAIVVELDKLTRLGVDRVKPWN